MHTKDKLAAALEGVGLGDMAAKAREGYYHDFLSPLPMPEVQLAMDLAQAANADKGRDTALAILDLRQRVIEGEFDASKEEGEEWARTPEGKDAMRSLVRGAKRYKGAET